MQWSQTQRVTSPGVDVHVDREQEHHRLDVLLLYRDVQEVSAATVVLWGR